ncbi:predicted protein [Uncinocarpus reesii 1704]|uniref:Zn(2)-C6 fungal-type domain-containing protein n=1 Tax=Uncinocarpus reesii (strain UAMH 1704) TaxID=336963 RepID=C4JG45_UNCRE|nr:uncharacterized protein UREG_02443 [Uncinocarpus reesii 1704]EEP77594.1 predicted protein [Uncinocarpus reesii 1704]
MPLACRKRRIKCGEEKPRCNNCIKSKRECEGYGQRVIFRDPVGPIPHLGPISSARDLTAANQGFLNRQFVQAFHHGEPTGVRSFLPLAPRPSAYGPVADAFVRQEFTSSPPGIPQPIQEDQYSWNAIQFAHPHQPAAHNFSQPGQNMSTHQIDPDYQLGAPYNGPTLLDHPEDYLSHGPQMVYQSQFASSVYMDNASLSLTESGQYRRQHIPPDLGAHSDVNHNPQPTVGMEPEFDPGFESDDYYDVETDEELDELESNKRFDSYGRNASILPRQLLSSTGQVFTYESYESFLTTYHPSPLASPLLDPQHFQVFYHFMTVAGPALSIFERHPYVPSAIMSNGSIPPEQQNLWSYTLPTMALEHQGLLQAMLAFSTLLIAKTTNQPLTACFRHYHYALRKVGKAVGLPYRRKQISTLAATLLLGFFEVMGAEHNKWNNHLAGAAHLIRETDFAGMTRDIRAMRARAASEQWLPQAQGIWTGPSTSYLRSYFENDIFAPVESDIDIALINTLTGKAINYDEFGQVGSPKKKPETNLTPKDVDDYRVRCDLYWWYCKQDVFHSIISGNALLLPYDRWGECPPRAGVGKLDAAYGSMDHLILLLARISTFVFKDRKRKLKSSYVWHGPAFCDKAPISL